MKYLIDTCVISEVMKKDPNKKVVQWIDSVLEEDIFISVLTLGELQKGISKIKDKKRSRLLQHWLDVEMKPRFEARILDIDCAVVEQWGSFFGKREQVGVSLPAIDSLIAATANTHNLIVVTRNIKDFEKCGVECIDPF